MPTSAKKQAWDREGFLAVRPRHAESAVLNRKSDGGATVTIQRRVQWPLGWSRDRVTKTFELDEIGLWVWDACDENATILDLINGLARQYRLSVRESEVATTKFLETLATRRLITMRVER